ncbi:MAG TPA: type II CAAX endopeptidase family protein [Caulobacteraceae bacterium]|jgi:membrane protease YdiL (CAAX protease family)|nr:type II CAAX endopeptidase family protein [Caulobacteraceae bacterium]
MSIVNRIGAFCAAAAASFAIVAIGQGLWQPLVLANLRFHPQTPWAPAVMAVVLSGLIAWLSGRGWPRAGIAARRRLLRWNSMPWATFALALGAGLLGLAAFGALWILAADLLRIPPGIQPRMGGVPIVTAVAFLVTSALAAPLSEEAAFRGYAMGMLQQAWGSPGAAIVGSSVLFAAVHFLQGIDPAKLALYFTAGLLFAVIGYLTNSLYAVMVVHGFGDVLGFTVLWPHDQSPHAMGFADPLFAPSLVVLAVATPLAILGLRRLAAAGAPLRKTRAELSLRPGPVAA